ncbi:MAG: hypothetical protein CBD36_006430 [Candidatus Puniceispirillum sp. TMED176]|nr:MAG: hypothetical protein CBD36_006430 [Candidatus Puniceispirillum sp. TMED176]
MPFVSTTITVDDRTITTTFDAATNSYNLSIPENSAAGIGIGNGKVEFKGRGPAETLYTLLGPDAARVRLADDGTLTLARGWNSTVRRMVDRLHLPSPSTRCLLAMTPIMMTTPSSI